ncbi:purine nucleoside phosphorylase YfiH [Martelella alba]|uniref:Purine nucleoside phosphorylase n=1 Tax=Martelella alba TaxID=2590451 RepID=A0ABY2SRR3_9HYPH|nr:purine nucleoside phosphorylase YfiH [Martelella alba]TKI08909.1 polyphenol oxidase [Martelella alba]
MTSLLLPEWPAPANVRACSTTRQGGVSQGPYRSLNLGCHVGDSAQAVAQNRRLLGELAALPGDPHWLRQVHGTDVVSLSQRDDAPRCGDGVYTRQPGRVCAVMTADCLPVLFCDRAGREVAAAHAGWRGLCAGILEQTLARFQSAADDIIVWLGPAIGSESFEVGPEVRAAFLAQDRRAGAAFRARGDKYLADLYHLARLRLNACGVHRIYGGDRCTMTESDLFFSYRRDGVTGRMASLVWLI